jgi:hypothetical protein
VENKSHKRWPWTSIAGENSDCVEAFNREKRRITVGEFSGMLNISDGSMKAIINLQFQ